MSLPPGPGLCPVKTSLPSTAPSTTALGCLGRGCSMGDLAASPSPFPELLREVPWAHPGHLHPTAAHGWSKPPAQSLARSAPQLIRPAAPGQGSSLEQESPPKPFLWPSALEAAVMARGTKATRPALNHPSCPQQPGPPWLDAAFRSDVAALGLGRWRAGLGQHREPRRAGEQPRTSQVWQGCLTPRPSQQATPEQAARSGVS